MGEKLNEQIHIVGIGASAGGLEALELFFSQVSQNNGIAYVVIQHLSPDFKSMMSEILARVTRLPIFQITNGITLEPDTIYLNVPRNDVVLENGRLYLEPSKKASTGIRPISRFFLSLADDLGPRAIGVILSGSGQDGAEGMLGIDQAGGLTLIQDLESALFSSMPKAAADQMSDPLMMSPSEMPGRIMRHVFDPDSKEESLPGPALEGDESALTYLISLLRRRFEIDFTRYKSYTLFRRLDARIKLARVKDLAEYILVLQDDVAEQNALYRDLLIDVTSFFRDPEAFHIIERQVIPDLVAAKEDGESIRLWVAACATGEEAYSLAILVLEEIEKQGRSLDLKVFATDAHQDSIATASEGVYSDARLELVRASFKEKYFNPVQDTLDSYQVISPLRSKIVFATHNLLENPHFSYLDMVSCRNFLIYISDDTQDELLFRFHMGLKLNGYLFLGASEHLRGSAQDYEVLSHQWRIFKKIGNKTRPTVRNREDVVSRLPKYLQQQGKMAGSKNWETRLLQELFETGYVVDSQGSLKEVYGDGRKYLQFKTGKVALTLTSLLPDSLATPIRTGLQMAQQKEERVRFEAIDLYGGASESEFASADERFMTLEIIPFQGASIELGNSTRYYLISLSPIKMGQGEQSASDGSVKTDPAAEVTTDISKISGLERELTFTRESLQATIEEMQSANEELQSANEELQSTNEELSSVNEELFTVNSEFQEQNQIHMRLTNDMRNMLSAGRLVMILLNKRFELRELTPHAKSIFGFLDSDIGRSVLHFNLFKNIEQELISGWFLRALDGEEVSETIITTNDRQMTMHVMPFLSTEDELDGLILYFVDA